jgi:ankyrin
MSAAELPLIEAAHRNDLAAVKKLLAAKADARAISPFGVTALLEAAGQGNATMVEALLVARAEANRPGPDGRTPLMAAARAGNAEAVRALLRHGAEVNFKEAWKNQTALMWAAAANRAEAVEVLAAAGAEVNARSMAWLDKVKAKEDGNLVSTPPKGGLTPLLYASRQGALEAAKALVKAGADVNLADPDSSTPLLVAILNAHYDLAAILLEAGADPNRVDKWGRGPLYAALDLHTLEPSVTRPAPKTSDKLTGLDIARLALEHGANTEAALLEPTPGRGVSDNPDPILRAGATPFIRAAKTGDIAAMKLLLKHGANAKATTKAGVNALMAAAGLGWRYGDSVLPEAEGLASVKFCLDLGFDIQATDVKGRTALHGAAERGGTDIVDVLVKNGARMDAKDKEGKTPFDIAKGGNQDRSNPEYPATVAVFTRLAAAAGSGR